MSVPTTIQSNQVPLQLSSDGVTYKNVVCKRTTNFNGTTSVNVEETDCGIEKGLGTPDWTIGFEGVVNTTPTSTTELSTADLLSLWLNKTLTYTKFLTGDGTGKNIYIQGTGYITDLTVDVSTGNLVAFSFTLNGVGNPDITV